MLAWKIEKITIQLHREFHSLTVPFTVMVNAHLQTDVPPVCLLVSCLCIKTLKLYRQPLTMPGVLKHAVTATFAFFAKMFAT